jgi:replicative DNA helicase
MTTPREPIAPHDLDAEMSLLGAMLLEREVVPEVVEQVTAEDYHDPRHAEIHSAIVSVFDRNLGVDFVTVGEELQRRGRLDVVGGRAYLVELSRFVPSGARAVDHARIVREFSTVRRLARAADEILAVARERSLPVEELLDLCEGKVFDVARAGRAGASVSIRDVLREVMARILDQRSRGGLVTGLPTGFREFDEMTAGLQAGDFVVVAGRPSMGKTAFALTVAEHVALEENRGVAVFSLEMSREQVAQRMVCARGRVDAHRLRTNRLSESDYALLADAQEELSRASIFIDDTSSLTPLTLRARARRLRAQHDVGLVIVDYLQLLEAPGLENRQQQISFVSRSLKALAREIQAPVLALSQLNRATENRDDKRPRLADLRESGSIEQDADLVCFLFREGYYRPRAAGEEGGLGEEEGEGGTATEVIVAKQRNGPTGTIRLTFLPHCLRFARYAPAISAPFPA